MSTAPFRQPALAGSAFAGFTDELLAYLTLFCEPRELLRLAEVNSVFHVFCQEDPLWMAQCLRLHGGDFSFLRNWKLTTFFPREPRPRPQLERAFRPIAVRGFGSDFLYRRWCRCHMPMGDAFALPPETQDPHVRRLHKFDLGELSFRDFYEQYSRMPFILRNAISKWKASTEWTLEKLAARFPDDVKLRITHNLDIFSSSSSLEMSFGDYLQYATQQHDETPLYIFDPRFGEKMPALLEDYNAGDLQLFREDFLSVVDRGDQAKSGDSGVPDAKVDVRSSEGVKLAAGGKKVRQDESKKRVPGSIRPDFRWLVVGPERTGAPWHTDPARTSAWNSLVKGRKRWAIYPPTSPPPGVRMGKNGEDRVHAMNMPSLMWYLHVYPTLAPDEKPLEIIQEEGETIYVPSGWWHLVLNLDVTVAVTQNFVDSHNAVAFIKDLLADQQDEALEMLQHRLKKTRPETFDIFRLALIPRAHGYLSEELYVGTFRILEYWKSSLKKVLKRHQSDGSTRKPRVRVPKMKSLTSRVNPTFAVGKRLLIKFFSQFNETWSEVDSEAYLTPKLDDEHEAALPSSSKRRKQDVLQPHELKTVMSLRYALEESFRIERSVYDMVGRAASMQTLQAMVPRLYHAGHLLSVDEVDDEDGEGSMWRWPYVVLEYKSDAVALHSLAKKRGLTASSWRAVATWIGSEFLPRLHAVPIAADFQGVYGHSKAHWDWYVHYLLRQRQRALSFHLMENGVPAHLLQLLEGFLPAARREAVEAELLPSLALSDEPVLLHGDVTDENVLGRVLSSPDAPSSRSSANCADLTTFLRSVGCEKYVPLLVTQQEMTMASLDQLDEQQLERLGLPLGPRLAILNATQAAARVGVLDSEDDGGAHWDSSTSSSGESSSDEEEEQDDSDALTPEALAQSRRDAFLGPHEWTPTAVIDFADAKTGDPLYDLVAVFFAALHCDRELWKQTLASEYWQTYVRREKLHALTASSTSTASRRCLRERFLQLVLLHPSRSIKALLHYFPQAANCATWEELAEEVFSDVFA